MASNTESPGTRRVRATASDELTREVLDLIKTQELVPGDRLPGVAMLAEQFGVAPPTIREALRRLQALGFIDMRHGSGVYVRRLGERVIVSNPYSGQLEAATMLDLIDARLVIEPHLACLAVGRANEKSIREIEVILDKAERTLEGGDEDALNSLNLGFHRSIAHLSGNVVLAQTMDSLLDLYSAEQIVIQRIYDDREQDHREHAEILAAIRDRRADLATTRMQSHLAGVRDVLEQRLNARKPSRRGKRN